MATQEDVRRIALSLPQASEAADHFGFGVLSKGKLRGFAWAWNERIEPKKPRVPNPEVLAVRVASLAGREELLAADPEKFFTEPHYNGFPAVLVRLSGDRRRRTRGADHRRLALPGTPRPRRRARPPSAVGPGAALGAGGEHLAAAVIADLDILQPRLPRQRGELGVGVEVAEAGQRLRGGRSPAQLRGRSVRIECVEEVLRLGAGIEIAGGVTVTFSPLRKRRRLLRLLKIRTGFEGMELAITQAAAAARAAGPGRAAAAKAAAEAAQSRRTIPGACVACGCVVTRAQAHTRGT